MKPLFELLKEQVSEQIGKQCFYAGDISNIISRLGKQNCRINRSIIKNNLREHRILPQDIGFNPAQYGFAAEVNVSLYSQDAVWDYLRKLEERGEISLTTRGIYNFEQLIEQEYHRPIISKNKVINIF